MPYIKEYRILICDMILLWKVLINTHLFEAKWILNSFELK